MKGLKKLVLASAIAAASSSAFAMQAMDDEAMSAATGQDGLTITINSMNLDNLDVKYIDRDGLAAGTYTNAGAIHIFGAGGAGDGLSISSTGTTINIDVGGNAGTGAGTEGQLFIDVTMGATTVNLQNVTIAVADADNTSGSTTGTDVAVLQFGTGAALNIAAGGTARIRLGERDAADSMIEIASTLPSLSLSGLSIVDAVGGGRIGVGTLTLGTLTSNVAIDVVPAGLTIDTTGTTVASIALENVQLGTVSAVSTTRTASTIGDIYIAGASGNIALDQVITITGH